MLYHLLTKGGFASKLRSMSYAYISQQLMYTRTIMLLNLVILWSNWNQQSVENKSC